MLPNELVFSEQNTREHSADTLSDICQSVPTSVCQSNVSGLCLDLNLGGNTPHSKPISVTIVYLNVLLNLILVGSLVLETILLAMICTLH